jgi:hypothetical protein
MAAARPAPLRIADLPPELRARSAAFAAEHLPTPGPADLLKIAPYVRPALAVIGQRQAAERQQPEPDAA